jgi:hypothetical protein
MQINAMNFHRAWFTHKLENSRRNYPASDGEPGCWEKICGVQQTPPVKTPCVIT